MVRMSTELNRLLNDQKAHLGDMMQKALNYLHNYWRQLFAYRQDGRYTIDNNIVDLNSATLQFNFIYKFLSNRKLLRILPCQIFHLS